MSNLEVKVKKLHPDAVVPKYAKPGDAGLDLTTINGDDLKVSAAGQFFTYRTGLAVEIPEGYVGLIFPRSSISKTCLSLTNAVGVIDSGYRGEIIFKFRTESRAPGKHVYKKGDRVGQLVIMPYPKVEFVEVEELSETDRGEGGFGSTGK